jgi:tetratricopeptide (TPR) repeat protein
MEITDTEAEDAFQLAKQYLSQLKYQEALIYFQKATDLQPENTIYLSKLADHYIILGDFQKTIEYYEKVLKIYLTTYGENYPGTADCYNDIGEALRNLGDYQKMMEYFQKSFKIDLFNHGEYHPRMARNYNNFGLTYLHSNSYSKAIEFFDKALKIQLVILGENHPVIATLYNNLGSAWSKLRDAPKAFEYIEKALKIKILNYGENDIQVAHSYHNLGSFYYNLSGDKNKAIEYYKKALEIFTDKLGAEHPDTKNCLQNLTSTKKELDEILLIQTEPVKKESIDHWYKEGKKDYPEYNQPKPNWTDMPKDLIGLTNEELEKRNAPLQEAYDKGWKEQEELSKNSEEESENIKGEEIMLAFFDVLGFSERLANAGLEQIYSLYEELIEIVKKAAGGRMIFTAVPSEDGGRIPMTTFFTVHYHYFSDTIMLWGKYHPSLSVPFIDLCNDFMCEAIKRKLPLRGCITFGKAIMDKKKGIFLGDPIIEAARGEAAQSWIGVSFGPSLNHPKYSWLGDLRMVLPFTKQIKPNKEKYVEQIALDWTRKWRTKFDTDPTENINALNTNPEVSSYYETTNSFIAFSTQNPEWWKIYDFDTKTFKV